ncbi:uncharacterized protein FIBRA_01500 [Fibroporia radiculosa]|uniref:Uncharacterized protein n=1 Tax=Fibroporia radiculosa TaxID=599839 RepID=J4HTF7_9APHY|nr:uncharacterized protein FIBRA_01500 [Fibroporia radiculosa]CCL99482.1 predicted protein [Fibroporia radiculosa]
MIMQTEDQRKVWLITGTSSGFGKRLVASVLARGDYVIATVRSLEKFSLPSGDRSRLRIIALDVTDSFDTIQRAVHAAVEFWGRIDVLVNNAGYGLKSLLEEGGATAAMTQFQTNVFGVINVTNAVLPHMRARRTGTVVMMGSRSVWKADTPVSIPAALARDKGRDAERRVHHQIAGYYVASKAAIHALGETYATELAQHNVRVTICAPGAFRTENVHAVPYTQHTHIPEYDALRTAAVERFADVGKHARGDPAKAMEVLVDAVRGERSARGKQLPLYLMLGNVTYEHVRAHQARVEREMAEWEDVARDLDFDVEC